MSKERLEEIIYNIGRSLNDNENVLIKESDIKWLIDTIENQQSEIDTLSMAHDAMHRKLSTYKESLPRDKHTLIKTIHSLNKRVQELEDTNNKNYWIASDFKFENLKLEQQNKRHREALEWYSENSPHGNIADEALEGEE